MKKKYLRALAKAATVRAIKTVAQTAIATIGSAAVLGAVDWRIVVSASALAGLLSLLTSIAGLPEVPDSDGDGIPDDVDDDQNKHGRQPMRAVCRVSVYCSFLRVVSMPLSARISARI